MPRERPRTSSAELSVDRVLEDLTARIARLNPKAARAIDPDAPLLDAGYVDSLTAAELLAAVEDRYGVRIRVDRLAGDLSSLRALAACIAAGAPGAP